MKFKIYDFDNEATIVETPDKPIDCIMVTILSGDETGTIYFEDGESQSFDASDCRTEDFFDEAYVVMGNEVDKWASIVPRIIPYESKSYKRANIWKGICANKIKKARAT